MQSEKVVGHLGTLMTEWKQTTTAEAEGLALEAFQIQVDSTPRSLFKTKKSEKSVYIKNWTAATKREGEEGIGRLLG